MTLYGCYELARVDGEPLDWETVPHWTNALDGYRDLREMNDEAHRLDPDHAGPVYKLDKREGVCVEVDCEVCGLEFWEDGGTHVDAATLSQDLRDAEWAETATGYRCPTHTDTVIDPFDCPGPGQEALTL